MLNAKLNRIAAHLLGCTALVGSLLVYLTYVYMLGFPDGFIGELARAERELARVFIAVSTMLSVCFVYLGLTASRAGSGWKLIVAVAAYLILIISTVLIDIYFHYALMGGGGG